MKRIIAVITAYAAVLIGQATLAASPAAADALPPGISYFGTSGTVFNPTVKDGYRDTLGIWWQSKRDEPARIDILNSAGRIIKTRRGSWGDMRWDGRSGAGYMQPAGMYRIRLTVTNPDGVTVSQVKRVEIERKWAIDTIKMSRLGTNTTSRERTANCYIDGYDGSLTLDCWGGRYAIARYAFQLPKSAKNPRWWVQGEARAGRHGILSRTGKRVSATRFVVTVKVTYLRAFTIHTANVEYTANRWW